MSRRQAGTDMTGATQMGRSPPASARCLPLERLQQYRPTTPPTMMPAAPPRSPIVKAIRDAPDALSSALIAQNQVAAPTAPNANPIAVPPPIQTRSGYEFFRSTTRPARYAPTSI